MPNNKNNEKLKIDRAIAKYTVAINKNNSESEVLWNRYNAMLVFNTILITAIGMSYQNDVNLPLLIRIFLPLAGLIVCYLWYLVTSRGFTWINFWISTARKIEEKYLKDSLQEQNPILNGNDIRRKDKSSLRTEKASQILILIIVILYIIFLIYAININIPAKTLHLDNQKRINFHFKPINYRNKSTNKPSHNIWIYTVK